MVKHVRYSTGILFRNHIRYDSCCDCLHPTTKPATSPPPTGPQCTNTRRHASSSAARSGTCRRHRSRCDQRPGRRSPRKASKTSASAAAPFHEASESAPSPDDDEEDDDEDAEVAFVDAEEENADVNEGSNVLNPVDAGAVDDAVAAAAVGAETESAEFEGNAKHPPPLTAYHEKR
jgi:hypothetical protein